MAATNPFKSHDLLHKYGWDIIPYLSNLGVRNLAEAQLLFVDSGSANKLDADDTEHGHSFEKPLATVDYAIGLCTASEGAIILVAPGHYEDYDDSTTGFDADVVGITIIGLGVGSLRPRFDFDNAASSCLVGANDIQIKNVVFRPGAPDVLIGLDYETGITGVVLEDVEFAIGEGGAADEFKKAVHLTSGNHDCKFKNVRITAHAGCGGATHGIHIDAASDRLVFQNVVIDGPYATGGIVEEAAGLNHIVEDCSVDVFGTNYRFDSSSTFAKYTRNVDAGVDSEESEALIEVDRGAGVYPTGITNKSILAFMMSASGTPAASSFDNTDHSLEAIGDNVLAITNQTGVINAVPAAPTAGSLQDALNEDQAGANTYNSATDSLEAISNLLRDDADVLAGINLDHLAKTVDGGTHYPTQVTAQSILGMIMATSGDPADFVKGDDSLQAISDKVTALGITGAVSTSPTARSLQDILEKDTGGHFVASTDSLEAIADRLIDSQVDVLTGAVDGGTNIYPDSVVTKSVLAYLMTSDGDITGYNYAKDSLEAIADALAAGTGCTAAIEADGLDHLCQLDGTAAYPQTVATDSIIAKICSVGDAANPNTYDNAEDSLQAISEFVRTGTTVLAGIELDHLVKTIAPGTNFPSNVTTNSILAMIMADDGIVTGYDKTKHSLEAIGTDTDSIITNIATAQTELDKIGTLENTGGADAELGTILGDFANVSLVTKLSNLQTDADQWGALANTDGTAELGAMLGDFANSSLVTRLGVITTDTAAIDPGATRVHTRTLSTWTATANALWDVSAPVKAKIWGVVLGAIKNVAMNLKIGSTPTAPGGLVDITANLDCQADAVGTVYKCNTTLGGAMVEVTGGVTLDNGIEVILPAGTVTMTSAAVEDGTGSIQWIIEYEPLVAGAVVTDT